VQRGVRLAVPGGGGEVFEIDVRLPVDLHSRPADLAELRAAPAGELEAANRDFWTAKLLGQGLQPQLPRPVGHLTDLFRQARSQLLILSDQGEIHPGPTVYDSFGIRDWIRAPEMGAGRAVRVGPPRRSTRRRARFAVDAAPTLFGANNSRIFYQ
jgi:hypothetical protein